MNSRVRMALIAVVIVYPMLRFVLPYFDSGSLLATRADWWRLWIGMLVGHWLCFALCAYAIRSVPGRWQAIGLNWHWFTERKFYLLTGLAALTIVAFLTPELYYGDAVPAVMRAHPLGPVSQTERLFWIVMAVSAGVVEEVLYRGFALTQLKRTFNLPVAIIVSTAAFALMHGPSVLEPRYLSLYVLSSLAFIGLFIWFRYRHLQWLILIHALGDLLLVMAP